MKKNKEEKVEKSAVESFLEDTNENASSFALPKENEDEQEIKAEEKEEEEGEEEEKEEKPLPFHQDPKIQKYLDKREKEIEQRVEARINSIPTSQPTVESEFKDVIDSFTTIIGNDTPEKVNALNALERSLKGFDEKAIKRAEAKLQEIRDGERQEEIEAEQELDDAFENIELNYDVDLTSAKSENLRKEFVIFVEKIAPKDRYGEIIDYPDMNSAWETFSEIKKATKPLNRAKDLASNSLARSAETIPTKQERMDWNKVDEYVDTLKT